MRLKALLLATSALTLVAALRPQPLSAQQVAVAPGTRVRVQAASLVAPLIANFLEQRSDTLVFIEDGTGRGVWSFPLAQIQRLETTAGESGRNRAPTARGAAYGAGAGLVVGLMFAAAARPTEDGRTYNRPVTGLVGAGIGAAIGAFIGSRQRSERWINVPLPGRFSLAPDLRGGIQVGFTIR